MDSSNLPRTAGMAGLPGVTRTKARQSHAQVSRLRRWMLTQLDAARLHSCCGGVGGEGGRGGGRIGPGGGGPKIGPGGGGGPGGG